MSRLFRMIEEARGYSSMARDAARSGNLKVLRSLLGPAFRGFVLKQGKRSPATRVPARFDAHFDWRYERDRPDLSRLYRAAKQSQWDAERDIDWSISVDPEDEDKPLIEEHLLPLRDLPIYQRLDRREQKRHSHAMVAWLMSQFLHGEQGALFAAAQVTEAVPWTDGMLYGSTQVVDEGRHVEVFHKYATEKLEKLYEVNDNLFVVIDALMRDGRWDMKFLGMQVMIEGLALGAFGTIRQSSKEPLMREMLKLVITDEARHVHFGVLALADLYTHQLSERERREREDWAFEISLLLRNRFLAHEVYEELYAHAMSRTEWDRALLASDFMGRFRRTMFRRIIPNLKRIGLLTDRIRPHYEALGLLVYEHERAAPELTATEVLAA